MNPWNFCKKSNNACKEEKLVIIYCFWHCTHCTHCNMVQVIKLFWLFLFCLPAKSPGSKAFSQHSLPVNFSVTVQWTLPAVKLSVEWEVDWFPCLQTFLGQWERSIGVNQSSLWLESGQPFELTVAVHHLPDELLFMSQELSGGRGGRLLDRLCQFCFCLAINSTVCQKKCWHIGNIREKNRLPYCQVFLFLIWLPGNRFHKNVVFNWSVPSITVMPKRIRKNLWNKTFLYSYLPFVYDQGV